MPKPARTLTASEFESAIAHLRISEENIAVAKKALVQGVPMTLLAKGINHKSKQALDKVVKRIWDKFLDLQGTPKGWLSIRVDLPFEEAIKIKQREKQLKQQLLGKYILKE